MGKCLVKIALLRECMVYYPFYFVGKKVILNTLERIARSYKLQADGEYFYYPHGICFRGLHGKKNRFEMEWVLVLSLYGTKLKRE